MTANNHHISSSISFLTFRRIYININAYIFRNFSHVIMLVPEINAISSETLKNA